MLRQSRRFGVPTPGREQANPTAPGGGEEDAAGSHEALPMERDRRWSGSRGFARPGLHLLSPPGLIRYFPKR
jgi:hypothetical protein